MPFILLFIHVLHSLTNSLQDNSEHLLCGPILQTLAAYGETEGPHRVWTSFGSWGEGNRAFSFCWIWGVEAMKPENLGLLAGPSKGGGILQLSDFAAAAASLL